MENLYHYIWKTKIRGSDFTDVDGRKIEVLDPGIHNLNAGPDFFNAKIRCDSQVWVGNVEIHVKASDWFRHNHEDDPAYGNVILHVVAVSDKRINRADGSLIPQVELTLPEYFFKTLASLIEKTDEIRCRKWIRDIDSLNACDWLDSLAVERLQDKAKRLEEMKKASCGDWEQTCFIALARGLGFGLNSDPFELVAKSIPLRVLHHHSDNLMQLEALLFGQAAMLDPTLHMFDEYFQGLCREYYFLARKYGLRPINAGLWKYARTRPQNFPHRRVALLAAATSGGFSLFSKLLDNRNNPEELIDLFDMKAQGYWESHFSFNDEAAVAPVELSRSSKVLLAINVAVPLLYAYAASTGDFELGEKALAAWCDFPAENNAIVRQWKTLGFEADDASRSQALIHLRKEYCDKGKCMYCRFGNLFLRNAAKDS